jgi:predicted RNA-binding protein YlxR (DUF448 family)
MLGVYEVMEVVTVDRRKKKGRGGYIKLRLNLNQKILPNRRRKNVKCHYIMGVCEVMEVVTDDKGEKKGRGGCIKVSLILLV